MTKNFIGSRWRLWIESNWTLKIWLHGVLQTYLSIITSWMVNFSNILTPNEFTTWTHIIAGKNSCIKAVQKLCYLKEKICDIYLHLDKVTKKAIMPIWTHPNWFTLKEQEQACKLTNDQSSIRFFYYCCRHLKSEFCAYI